MNLPFSSFGPPLSGKTLLALGEAAEAQFDSTDWTKFAYEVDEANLICNHPRLLRSLSFGDTDYGECVLQVVRHLQNNRPSALGALAQRPKIRTWIEENAPDAALELGLGQAHVVGPLRTLSSSEVVDRALKDADHLLHTRGPVSCVDRLHTALHGYLRDLCGKAGLTFAPDASLTTLFKLLRTEHPSFKNLGPQDQEMARVLGSMAATVDALNTLRNRASVAHPNEALLGEPEAMLMVNITRSLFHYLEAKT
ncbi:hypothetical protein N792_03865 [Lysobacter concretionis Ko07 = DSM 16239]|uniref:Abortive infection protein-like C-terminal domain-containing protein n=1 Tax=Lysobacter concretionis Ko07 = DSM 16239 TaxID=1122185 RepID=A0A0A0ESZ8_9GAMM|nr:MULTISPECIES: abortive infection family protein [Lysobacter]KGM52262.1 hypothetical protein N792_03865 [Lysobacter concretionis Ko07 = DSM 16239]QOD92009.1 abortive infection family protein [Lysobacter sp. CW239]